jgi:hypothetical protein
MGIAAVGVRRKTLVTAVDALFHPDVGQVGYVVCGVLLEVQCAAMATLVCNIYRHSVQCKSQKGAVFLWTVLVCISVTSMVCLKLNKNLVSYKLNLQRSSVSRASVIISLQSLVLDVVTVIAALLAGSVLQTPGEILLSFILICNIYWLDLFVLRVVSVRYTSEGVYEREVAVIRRRNRQVLNFIFFAIFTVVFTAMFCAQQLQATSAQDCAVE